MIKIIEAMSYFDHGSRHHAVAVHYDCNGQEFKRYAAGFVDDYGVNPVVNAFIEYVESLGGRVVEKNSSVEWHEEEFRFFCDIEDKDFIEVESKIEFNLMDGKKKGF